MLELVDAVVGGLEELGCNLFANFVFGSLTILFALLALGDATGNETIKLLAGWEGIVDDEGDEIPYSATSKAQLLNVPMMAGAIIESYFDSVVGNFASPWSPGTAPAGPVRRGRPARRCQLVLSGTLNSAILAMTSAMAPNTSQAATAMPTASIWRSTRIVRRSSRRI